jgi:hypothetical protein
MRSDTYRRIQGRLGKGEIARAREGSSCLYSFARVWSREECKEIQIIFLMDVFFVTYRGVRAFLRGPLAVCIHRDASRMIGSE